MTKSLHPSEHEEQAALIEWAQRQEGRWPELKLLHAIPNAGGYRGGFKGNARRVSEMQREGLKSGVPDLSLPVARGEFYGAYIELKAKGKKPKQNQNWWLAKLASEGYCARWFDEWVKAKEFLEWYLGLPKPEAVWSRGLER